MAWDLKVDQKIESVKEEHLAFLMGLAGSAGDLAKSLPKAPVQIHITLELRAGAIVSGTLKPSSPQDPEVGGTG